MRTLYVLGVLATCSLARWAAAHPLCYDDSPPDPDMNLQFCDSQDDGSCCNEIEEDSVILLYNQVSATALTGDCADYYKQVVCGKCNSYSGHLFERLGSELGEYFGMTMKSSFCSDLVSACSGQLTFPDYEDGESYCEKHVGGSNDMLWSYPIDPDELDFTSTGLTEAFPDLNDDELPEELIAMHMTPDGDEWWLAGQKGEIYKISSDEPSSSTLVLDIGSGEDLIYDYEEGVLDFAFSPAFNNNGYFYVSYTVEDSEGKKNRLSRFTYNSSPTTTKNSREIVLEGDVKPTSIHSAGWVGFKPSDYNNPSASSHDIYLAIGDGGPQEDPDLVGQDEDSLRGAILRVSVPSGTDDSGYSNPSGNYNGGRGEICAKGFRNPFRCGFDSQTDNLYCSDVGNLLVEEIDLIECGNNYGWSRFEGSRCNPDREGDYGSCDGASRGDFTFPIFEYCHPDYKSTEEGEDVYTNNIDICGTRAVLGLAVIAGHVYRGQRFSEVLGGALIFADAQKGTIYYLVEGEGGEWVPGSIISDGTANVISFAEDNAGELYVITAERKPYMLPCGDLCSTTCLEQSDVVPAYTSLGCFGDSPGNRALKLERAPSCGAGEDAMSPMVCAGYCETVSNAVYFGVEYAYECYCGSSDDDYDKHGELDEESCGTICVGTPDETCGGYSAIEVFSFVTGTPSPLPILQPTPVVPPTPVITPAPVVPPTPVITPAPVGSPTPEGSPTDEYSYLGCYGDSSSSRALTGESTSSSSMTIPDCADFCDGSQFFGTEYSTQCFCSATGDDYDALGTATCSMQCAGDSGETCGGYNSISVYEFTSVGPPSGSTYVGCYFDPKNDRVLDSASTTDAGMTLQVCYDFCDGSTYFGTEYSTQCFCGSPSSLGTVASNCDMECGGSSSEICGGNQAISIYSFDDGPSPPTPSTPAPIPVEGPYTFVGCYFDTRSNRVLTSDSTSDPDMTVEFCSDFCASSPYFGTEFSTQCFCGSPSSLGTTATNCDMACGGDSSEICGGYGAISLYLQDEVELPPTPAPVTSTDDYDFVGCYYDVSSNRVLGSDSTSNPAMTADLCYNFCTGSAYFGTEFSTQCFCGSPSSLGTTATNCNMECGGDSSEICGGYNAISVYEYPESSSSYTYQGCFTDSKSARVMAVMTTSGIMTPEICASYCAGYAFFGTQFSSECWCSNSEAYDAYGSSTACTMACAGDSATICGGRLAMSVYEL